VPPWAAGAWAGPSGQAGLTNDRKADEIAGKPVAVSGDGLDLAKSENRTVMLLARRRGRGRRGLVAPFVGLAAADGGLEREGDQRARDVDHLGLGCDNALANRLMY
jgi:hypothetical protein